MTSNFIRCPLCQTQCADFRFDHRLIVNHCTLCNQLWLDQGEIEIIAGTKEIKIQPNDQFSRVQKHTTAKCPRCTDVQLIDCSIDQFRALTCENCRGNLCKAEDLAVLRKSATQKRHSFDHLWQKKRADFELSEESPVFQDSRVIRIFAIPVALIVGILSELSGIRVLTWFFTTLFHELGHASVKWLSGIFAIPLPFYTFWQNERSPELIVLFLLFWTFGIWLALQWRSRVLLACFIGLLMTQCLFSFFIPLEKTNEIALAYGIGGEILLGVLCVISFTWSLPHQLRWDFWRFPVLLTGGILFGSNSVRWFAIKQGMRPVPWGTTVGDTSDGDLSRLRDLYGWSEGMIISHYLLLIKIGLILIGLHYLFGIKKSLQF